MAKPKNVKSVNKNFPQNKICIRCNPKLYISFNHTYAKHKGEPTPADCKGFVKKLNFLSSRPWKELCETYNSNKDQFIERVDPTEIGIKIPERFSELNFPYETNEKLSIFRVKSKDHGKIRIIGVIKYMIFYIFYYDWVGELYSHS
jgi:hypothetical protein